MSVITEFWSKYEDADYFERKAMLSQLPLFKNIVKKLNDTETTDDVKEYLILSSVQSYVDDVIDYKNGVIDE